VYKHSDSHDGLIQRFKQKGEHHGCKYAEERKAMQATTFALDVACDEAD